VLENDYGSASTLNGRKTACSAASVLMSYGGHGLDRDTLNARMEQLQANWHVGLDRVFLEVPRKHLNQALSVLMAVWSEPTLPRDEFERYKTAQLTAYAASLKDPSKLADNQLRLRFNNYAQGDWNQPRSIEDLSNSIKSLTYEQVQQCARDFASISHARMGVVGRVSAQELQTLWREVAPVQKPAPSYVRVPLPQAPAQVDVTPIVVTQADTPNARVTGLSVIPLSSRSPDFVALQLAAFAIGGNSSSLIWQQVREREGLAYSSGMRLAASAMDERATVELFATSSTANASQVLNSLQSVLNKVLLEGLTPQQIDQAKAIWLEKRKAFLGDETLFAMSLANGLYDGQDFAYLADFDERLSKLDSATVTQVLRHYIRPSAVVWATGKGTP
jgi:zinc protease